MPISASSRSIYLPHEIAGKHDVQLLVSSRLEVPKVEQLNENFDDHLRFTQPLIETGVMPISGPFFTPDGKNTGNGFYVLHEGNLEERRRTAGQDPRHKACIRTLSVGPWLHFMN